MLPVCNYIVCHRSDECENTRVPISRRKVLALSSAVPAAALGQSSPVAAPYVDILRSPDLVTAFVDSETVSLQLQGDRWTSSGIAVSAEPTEETIPVRIEAASLSRVRLR